MIAGALPCPFCAAPPIWCPCDLEGCHRIQCSGCKVEFDTVDGRTYTDELDTLGKLRDFMVRCWNRRTTP